jgi:enolase
MDVAASEFYKEGKYDLDFKNPSSDASQVHTHVRLVRA